jgi:hypothetical protein
VSPMDAPGAPSLLDRLRAAVALVVLAGLGLAVICATVAILSVSALRAGYRSARGIPGSDRDLDLQEVLSR